MRNLSFNKYCSLREGDGNQRPIAGGYELPMNQAGGADQGPDQESDQESDQGPDQGHDHNAHDKDAISEEAGNQIRKLLTKLVKIDPQGAIKLLTTISTEISNMTGHSANADNSKEGLRTNAEPISPPMQPQVNA